jgi:hypothetical protein
VAPSRLHVKVDDGSDEVNVTVVLVASTVPLGAAVIDVSGGALSTITCTAGDVPTLPAGSLAWTVIVAGPSANCCVYHSASCGAYGSYPTVWPLTRNSTCRTDVSSLAVAVIEVSPRRIAPSPGDVTATVGAVVSTVACDELILTTKASSHLP